MMSAVRTFARYDETPDAQFYREPRLVEHIDEHARAAVEQLYRELLPQGGDLLDLMSSWVSHLPADVAYGRVVGLGMNALELAANPRLDAYVVCDLNAEPRLPFETASFDGVTLCVSIQYLTQAALVLREAARVARPGAPLAITFSNRWFPTKAVAIWQVLDGPGQLQLVSRYLREAGGWEAIETLDRSARSGDPLFAVTARRAPLSPI
jgi:SAM-dependent methyltransferase